MSWEEKWQAGETPWDKGAAAPPLLEHLAGDPESPLRRARHVLAPGCGGGHDVRALAALGVRVTGLDLSQTAVATAEAYPPAGTEDYRCGDLFDDSWYRAYAFDAIWEHTCFCAIDPVDRPRYVAAAAALLPPGGHLVGVFYLNPYDPGEDDTGPPWGATVEEITELFAPWFERISAKVPETAYPGREGREWLAVFRRLPDREVAAGDETV